MMKSFTLRVPIFNDWSPPFELLHHKCSLKKNPQGELSVATAFIFSKQIKLVGVGFGGSLLHRHSLLGTGSRFWELFLFEFI